MSKKQMEFCIFVVLKHFSSKQYIRIWKRKRKHTNEGVLLIAYSNLISVFSMTRFITVIFITFKQRIFQQQGLL